MQLLCLSRGVWPKSKLMMLIVCMAHRTNWDKSLSFLITQAIYFLWTLGNIVATSRLNLIKSSWFCWWPISPSARLRPANASKALLSKQRATGTPNNKIGRDALCTYFLSFLILCEQILSHAFYREKRSEAPAWGGRASARANAAQKK